MNKFTKDGIKMRKKLKEIVKRYNHHIVDELAKREALKKKIDEVSANDTVAIQQELYYCVDHVTSTIVRNVKANVMDVINYVNRELDTELELRDWLILSPQDKIGVITSRDHIAEAHENGHPGTVYC